jgi:hypothetical protein
VALVGARRALRAASPPLEQVGDPPSRPVGNLGGERMASEAGKRVPGLGRPPMVTDVAAWRRG